MNKPRPGHTILVYHLPAIAYAGLIIALSSLTNVRLPKTQIIALDKVIHFCEYAFFGVLAFRSASRWHNSVRRDDAAFLAIACITLYAFGDEFYQSFVPGRQADMADFYTDVVGSVVGVVIMWALARRSERVIG